MRVGFLGLGHMGLPVASRLASAGHELLVWNRDARRVEALRSAGARVAGSPADASAAGTVFTCLSDDAAVEEVVFGERGVLAGLPAGGVHVSLSTISPEIVRLLNATHEGRGQLFLSCPMVGRPEAAAKGSLVLLAAGSHAALDRVRRLLGTFGRKVVELGEEPSRANTAKLAVNFIIATAVEALGEAFALGRKGGVDAERLLEIVGDVFSSPVYAGYGDMIAHERFTPASFSLRLGLKDLKLVLGAAEEERVRLPLAEVVENRLVAAAARGMGDDDWAAVARLAFESAGLRAAAA
jgi:3-hydroxyisobutyrate dehydrogenase-like beta-hydroxyacid dehydrogenase